MMREVAAHDLGLVGLGETVELVDEADRVVHALGVREVRAEQHVVGAIASRDRRVFLVERVHVDRALERHHRVFVEHTGMRA